MLQIIKQHQKKYPQVHEYKKAEKQWNDIFGVTEKQIRAAVDEIEASIAYTMAQNHMCGVGNYWLNQQYNLFCETCRDQPEEQPYYLLKLERYEGEECVNTEFGITDTDSIDREELEKAIRRLLYQAISNGAILQVETDEKVQWTMTDPDCLQCLRVLSESSRVYELVQVNDYTEIDYGYRVAHGIIYLDRYSNTEIEIFFVMSLFSAL